MYVYVYTVLYTYLSIRTGKLKNMHLHIIVDTADLCRFPKIGLLPNDPFTEIFILNQPFWRPPWP